MTVVTVVGLHSYHHVSMNRRMSLLLAGMVLLSLMADLFLKQLQDIQEAMWACYWAAASIVAGVLLKSKRLVSCGVVFFVALGLPAWLLSIFLYDGHFEITSVLMHTVPLLSGLYYLSGSTSLPKYSAAGAWLLYAVPFGLSWRICKPSAMINLSRWEQWPLSGLLHHEWQFYGLLMTVSMVLVTAMASLLKRILFQAADPVRIQQRLT